MAKHVSARKPTFLKPLRKQEGTLRPNKSFGKSELFSTIKEKTHPFHMMKSNKVTLKTRETYFLHRYPQKLKNAKNVFRKLFSKKFPEKFLFTR